MLNLPNLDRFNFETQNVLYVGAGGGFDVFGALPLVQDFNCAAFANISASGDKFVVRAPEEQDYPERHLWLEGYQTWSIGRNGVQLMRKALEEIRKEFPFDTIVAIDGGVDSLMRGDEAEAGTYLEDIIMLTAIDQVPCYNKILACVGMGSETEENMNHYRALENMSHYAKLGGFLGACSLQKDSPDFNRYQAVCENAWSQGRKSHIHTKIISSVQGYFGDEIMYDNVDPNLVQESGNPNFISLLSSIYWFFDLPTVVKSNLLSAKLIQTNNFADAMLINRQFARKERSKEIIPL